MERMDAMPKTGLYSAPTDLSKSKPGDLLGQETASGYLFPLKKAVRILYHSLDTNGEHVVTSAVVLVPRGPTPRGGWPVIAWAHGTSGVASRCAPSLMRDVWYGDEGLLAMIKGGFAVVATDYHGLGTAGPHLWATKKSQAWDVIYSIPAARAAVSELGRRWVADGHSQGGLAAWGVAELESNLDDGDYLGAVSVSGTVAMSDFARHINENPEGFEYLTYLAATVQALYPEFDARQILTDDVMRRYPQATHDGCWFYGYALLKDLPRGGALKDGWARNQWMQKYAAQNEEGKVRVTKPLFVITGEGDRTIPIQSAREIVERACRLRSAIFFKSYPGLDHDPTMVASTPDQLAWIRDRFAGVRLQPNCAGT